MSTKYKVLHKSIAYYHFYRLQINLLYIFTNLHTLAILFIYITYVPNFFSALTLLVGRQEGNPAHKKTQWWGAGMVVCLERVADLHVAQLITLPLTVSCFSKIQIGLTFLVPAYPGSTGKRAVKRMYVPNFKAEKYNASYMTNL